MPLRRYAEQQPNLTFRFRELPSIDAMVVVPDEIVKVLSTERRASCVTPRAGAITRQARSMIAVTPMPFGGAEDRDQPAFLPSRRWRAAGEHRVRRAGRGERYGWRRCCP